MEEIGEVIGLGFHVAAIVFLVLARKEFWAKVRRGALFKAAAALVAGMAVGILRRRGGCWSCSPARWNARTGCPTRSTG